MQENYLDLANVYLLVFSVTDRESFRKAGELRARLKEHRPSENIPTILVGNKTDLVRSREVTQE
ncbi:hypothetical protein chiPu_0030381, partial [Chiloscyllium punctatum]|nr:hypothetical protein [Chiloscyllium punctatum]